MTKLKEYLVIESAEVGNEDGRQEDLLVKEG
jgi:hypothetical protein